MKTNQPNQRFIQYLVYTCNLCVHNSVTCTINKNNNDQLNGQYSFFLLYFLCIFVIFLNTKIYGLCLTIRRDRKRWSTEFLPVFSVSPRRSVYTFQDVPVSPWCPPKHINCLSLMWTRRIWWTYVNFDLTNGLQCLNISWILTELWTKYIWKCGLNKKNKP